MKFRNVYFLKNQTSINNQNIFKYVYRRIFPLLIVGEYFTFIYKPF